MKANSGKSRRSKTDLTIEHLAAQKQKELGTEL
jgi:hypothetical protein